MIVQWNESAKRVCCIRICHVYHIYCIINELIRFQRQPIQISARVMLIHMANNNTKRRKTMANIECMICRKKACSGNTQRYRPGFVESHQAPFSNWKKNTHTHTQNIQQNTVFFYWIRLLFQFHKKKQTKFDLWLWTMQNKTKQRKYTNKQKVR